LLVKTMFPPSESQAPGPIKAGDIGSCVDLSKALTRVIMNSDAAAVGASGHGPSEKCVAVERAKGEAGCSALNADRGCGLGFVPCRVVVSFRSEAVRSRVREEETWPRRN
jgi:hypothetical protein